MCSASAASTVTSRIFVPALDADEVDRAEQAAGLADRLGETRERARLVLEADAQRRAERRGRVRSVSSCRLQQRRRLNRQVDVDRQVDGRSDEAAVLGLVRRVAALLLEARVGLDRDVEGDLREPETAVRALRDDPSPPTDRLRSGMPRRAAFPASVTAKHDAIEPTKRSSGLQTPSTPPLNSGGVATSRSSLPATVAIVRLPVSQRTETGKS